MARVEIASRGRQPYPEAMHVENHRVPEIYYRTSCNCDPVEIVPRYIVNHYTAGWSGAEARDWLLGAEGGTCNEGSSAHVIIDLDGTAWQIVPFNQKAWHAGPSVYRGTEALNTCSIGIEYVNPGYLKPQDGGAWIDYHGRVLSAEELAAHGGYVLAPHERLDVGIYAWPVFTEAQLQTGRALTRALIKAYPIEDIVTHEEIDTRRWKTDPGPAFPQQDFKELLTEVDRPA